MYCSQNDYLLLKSRPLMVTTPNSLTRWGVHTFRILSLVYKSLFKLLRSCTTTLLFTIGVTAVHIDVLSCSKCIRCVDKGRIVHARGLIYDVVGLGFKSSIRAINVHLPHLGFKHLLSHLLGHLLSHLLSHLLGHLLSHLLSHLLGYIISFALHPI